MAYRPFTPTTYPSGNGVFDIYCVDLAAVAAPASNCDVRFSNPFVVLAVYDATVNSYQSWETVKNTTLNGAFGIQISSGILRQTDTGTITEEGAVKQLPDMQKIFYIKDYQQQGQHITTHGGGGGGIVETAQFYPNFSDSLDLLNAMDSAFDTVCVVANHVFSIDCGLAGTGLFLFMAVKRGENQPFFTRLP
jgi:hypothetical protein